MPSPSSLTLLPPRHTAQARHEETKTSQPASDDSFRPKLEKARKLKAAVKHTAEEPKPADQKPLPTKKTSDALRGPASDSKPEVPEVDPKKISAHPANQASQIAETQEAKKPAAPTKAVVQTVAQTEAHVAEPASKKLVKTAKTVATAMTPLASQLNPAAQPQNIKQHDVGDAVKAATDNSGPADAVATAQPNAVADGFFGSNKAVIRGAIASDATPQQGDATSADSSTAQAAASATTDADPPLATLQDDTPAGAPSSKELASISNTSVDPLALLSALAAPSASPLAHAEKAAAPVAPQVSFTEDNHPKIVQGIVGQLLPNGGTMHLRLDPPELGVLQVTVHMKEGVMTASFETSNDNATKLLSRSLGQLKSGLEAAGMSVEKLHVEQSPTQNNQQSSGENAKQPLQDQQRQAQQDQQRREMVQRMWRRLSGGDPLDLVA